MDKATATATGTPDSEARHARQCTLFRNLMNPFPRDKWERDLHDSIWGFVAVRTAYHPDPRTDAEQWEHAQAILKGYAYPKKDGGWLDRPGENFTIPIMSDRETLDGATHDQLRRDWLVWKDDYSRFAKERCLAAASAAQAEEISMRRLQRQKCWFPPGISEYMILVVDSRALTSLLSITPPSAPSLGWKEIWDPETIDPAILGLDVFEYDDPEDETKEEEERGYNPFFGSPRNYKGMSYLGYTLVYLPGVTDLHVLLRDMDFEQEIYSKPRKEGQLPFYAGDIEEYLLVPIEEEEGEEEEEVGDVMATAATDKKDDKKKKIRKYKKMDTRTLDHGPWEVRRWAGCD